MAKCRQALGAIVGLGLASACGSALLVQSAEAATAEADAVYGKAYALYVDLHQHPELSGAETATAAKLAGQLRALGYTVTEHVGGTGIVAVLRNGPGKTVMLRTELDALPVEEATGLPFASKAHAKDPAGRDVAVGHMCGHDLHMSALVATASIMAQRRDAWHGTLVLIGQPAEETISGAEKMVKDGLFTRFPRPDAVLALHVINDLPAGKSALSKAPILRNADSLRITIYGKGGHGSAPHTTVDPIVIAARTILALQTIVAREVKPGEFAVVTVGYLNAGTKNNIIPDQAELGLTVRTHSNQVRTQILDAITRIANAEAQAGNAARAPLIERYEATDAVYNDPALAQRLAAFAGSGARRRPRRQGRADHSVGGLLGVHCARNSRVLSDAGRRGAAEIRRGPCERDSPALEPLPVVRSGRRPGAAYGDQRRGCDAARSTERRRLS